MKTLKLLFLFSALLFTSIAASAQNCSLVLNGRSGNADLFEVTGNYQYITVTPKTSQLSYIRIDYYLGNNYYSEVLTKGQPYYLGAIKSFTISSTYSGVLFDPNGSTIYNAYESEMYIIRCN